MLLTVISTSCLKHDLDEWDSYTEKAVVGVQGVYWRYYGEEVIPGSGEHKVKQVRIPSGRFTNDLEKGTCSFVYQLGNLPDGQNEKFTNKNLVVVLNISTAATIEPLEGSTRLGVPGDWSKPNKYKITAADGSSQEWTVTLTELKE